MAEQEQQQPAERFHIPKRQLDWAGTPTGYLQSFTYAGDDRTVLSEIQQELVDDLVTHSRCHEKGRQTGYSYGIAAGGFERAQNEPGSTRIFCSHTLHDASRKITYAHDFHESLPELERRLNPLIVENVLSLRWANGSRLLCQFTPRGEGPATVCLDELAHIRQDVKTYTAALPILSRGGQLLVGSSVLAQSGRFWEIATGFGGRYQRFERHVWPWWRCPELCTDVEEAEILAPEMQTVERVERYGTEAIQAIYDGMPEEDFQQEYEAAYADETSSYYPWELIQACEMQSGKMDEDGNLVEGEAESYWCDSIPAAIEMARGLGGTIYAGFDVGRTRNVSELTLFMLLGSKAYEVHFQTFDQTLFELQEAALESLCEIGAGILVRLRIDSTGIGMELGERMKRRHGTIVEAVNFASTVKQKGTGISQPVKERMAVDTRLMMEAGNVAFQPDRGRQGQMHSIKRVVTAAKNLIFDVEKNEKHHADTYWSQALALSGIAGQKRRPRPRAATTTRQLSDPAQKLAGMDGKRPETSTVETAGELDLIVEALRQAYPQATDTWLVRLALDRLRKKEKGTE